MRRWCIATTKAGRFTVAAGGTLWVNRRVDHRCSYRRCERPALDQRQVGYWTFDARGAIGPIVCAVVVDVEDALRF